MVETTNQLWLYKVISLCSLTNPRRQGAGTFGHQATPHLRVADEAGGLVVSRGKALRNDVNVSSMGISGS